MFKESGVLFLYAETPLHPGGGTSLGIADLPIQRERHTLFPFVQASGVKGAFRDLSRDIIENKDLEVIFGPEQDGDKHAGALSFTDARLLLFPVRSYKGIFAWITCPTVLQRLKRDLSLLRPEIRVDWEVPHVESSQGLVPSTSGVIVEGNKVVLEEFTYTTLTNPNVDKLAKCLAKSGLPAVPGYEYWRQRLGGKDNHSPSHLVVLPDVDFRDFTRFSTEVLTRIRIDHERGTVKDHGLWYEEHLPPETLLYSLALATDSRAPKSNGKSLNATEVLKKFQALVEKSRRIQMGGDETVGRGILALNFIQGGI